MTRVTITGWREGLRKVSLARLLHEHTSLTLSQAKRSVDDVLEGREVMLTFGSSSAATRFVQSARKLNAICEVFVDERLDA